MNFLAPALFIALVQDPTPAPGPASGHAFVDVNVLTMEDGAEALEHRTVVVRDGRIASIGRAGEVALEPGTVAIDDGEPPIWPGSSVVTAAESAREVVAAQREAGYDFVKVYARLTPAAYDAIVAAARAEGLPVEGQVPTEVGIDRVLASGQRSVEHLDGHDRMLEADDSPTADADDILSRMVSWNHVDPAHLAPAASREAGVWNCPTIVVMQKWKGGEAADDERAATHMRYLPASTRIAWERMAGMRSFRGEEIRAGNANRLAFVGALYVPGAPLLVGTDTGNPWVAPGFSLHEELANFVAAGVPTLETLRVATRDAAEFGGVGEEVGTVTVGKRADLILVDADPREDLTALRLPRGVMVRGRWLDRDRLDAMLAELEEKDVPRAEER